MSNRVFQSVSVRIAAMICLIMLPVAMVSCVVNYRFMSAGIEQIDQAHSLLLDSYMSQVDRELELAENYMSSLTYLNGTTAYLRDRSKPGFHYAVNDLSQDIAKTALYYDYITGVFLYVPGSDFIYVYMIDAGAPASEEALKSFIIEDFAPQCGSASGWIFRDIEGSPYMARGFSSQGIYGGAFLSLERLPVPEEMTRGVKSFGFCREEELGEALPKGETLSSSKSGKCGLCVYQVFDRREAFSSLPFLQRYIMFFTVFMFLTLPLVFLALRRMIIKPLLRLSGAMGKLKKGDMDIRLEDDSREPIEFRQIDAAFNQMTSEIKDLKIEIYEERLSHERTRLQNLSYQLRPHFLINTLNMVYNYISSQDTAAAGRLIRFSANYLRYLLKLQDDFVPLQEELQHLENYMKIQSMRYEGQFEYEIAVDPFVEDIYIPNMILQNFIENSVKYSVRPDRVTLIRLTVDYCETDGQPMAVITVRDNGAGYPDWLLEALERGDMDALRDRVGLRNTLQRIDMLYGSRARCGFSSDGGAVSVFRFPLDDKSEKDNTR